jgi:hypothetical protein
MMDSFKALKSGDLGSVKVSMTYPLLRWCSGSETDVEWCAKINKNFWWLPKELTPYYIWIGLNDRNPYIKYPKASKKQEDKKEDLLKSIVMRFYGWSSQEYNRNSNIMSSIDVQDIADKLGLNDSERKLLGLNVVKVKVVKPKTKTEKSLFDFKKK